MSQSFVGPASTPAVPVLEWSRAPEAAAVNTSTGASGEKKREDAAMRDTRVASRTVALEAILVKDVLLHRSVYQEEESKQEQQDSLL
jgi:hypothetical protein